MISACARRVKKRTWCTRCPPSVVQAMLTERGSREHSSHKKATKPQQRRKTSSIFAVTWWLSCQSQQSRSPAVTGIGHRRGSGRDRPIVIEEHRPIVVREKRAWSERTHFSGKKASKPQETGLLSRSSETTSQSDKKPSMAKDMRRGLCVGFTQVMSRGVITCETHRGRAFASRDQTGARRERGGGMA